MRIEQLYYFLNVANTLSIAKSANNLFISPQGLSQSIATLERECGCSLFERTKSGIVLSEKGLEFKRLASELCEHHERFESEVAQLARGAADSEQSPFTLYVPPLLVVSNHLPLLMDDLDAQFPSLPIHVVETHLDHVLSEAAVQNSADFVGVVSVPDFRMGDIKEYPNLRIEYFLEIPMAVRALKDSKVAGKKLLTRKELSTLPIMCFNEPVLESIVRRLVEEYGEPNIVLRASTSKMMGLRKDAVALTATIIPMGPNSITIPLSETVMVYIAVVTHQHASQLSKNVTAAVKRFLHKQFPNFRVHPIDTR